MVKMQYTNKKMSALKSTEKSRVRPSFSIPFLLPNYAWTQIFQCLMFILTDWVWRFWQIRCKYFQYSMPVWVKQMNQEETDKNRNIFYTIYSKSGWYKTGTGRGWIYFGRSHLALSHQGKTRREEPELSVRRSKSLKTVKFCRYSIEVYGICNKNNRAEIERHKVNVVQVNANLYSSQHIKLGKGAQLENWSCISFIAKIESKLDDQGRLSCAFNFEILTQITGGAGN